MMCKVEMQGSRTSFHTELIRIFGLGVKTSGFILLVTDHLTQSQVDWRKK